MDKLTEEEIDETLVRLKAQPKYKDYNFTLEEAKTYLGQEYMDNFGLVNEKEIIYRANGVAEMWYEHDLKMLIAMYNILKSDKEQEKIKEKSRLYLLSIGCVV